MKLYPTTQSTESYYISAQTSGGDVLFLIVLVAAGEVKLKEKQRIFMSWL